MFAGMTPLALQIITLANTTAVALNSTSQGAQVLVFSVETTDARMRADGTDPANSTGVVFPAKLRMGATKYVGANSTGYTFTAGAAKPSTRTSGYNWTFITDSTGVSGIAVRTTGTTWKFVNVTTVLPT